MPPEQILKFVWQRWVKSSGRRKIWWFLLAILVSLSIAVWRFYPNRIDALTPQEQLFLGILSILGWLIIGLTFSCASFMWELNNKPIKFKKLLWDKYGNLICEKCNTQLMAQDIAGVPVLVSLSDKKYTPELFCKYCDIAFPITDDNGKKIHPSVVILSFKEKYLKA